MAKVITITEENAKAALKEADASGKKWLRKLFKGQLKESDKITDEIETIYDAFQFANLNYDEWLTEKQDKGYAPHTIARETLEIIIQVVNEDWKPDYTNPNTCQYFPVFDVTKNGSGFGFSRTTYGLWLTRTTVGSRLEFSNEETCKWTAEKFIDLYKTMLLK